MVTDDIIIPIPKPIPAIIIIRRGNNNTALFIPIGEPLNRKYI